MKIVILDGYALNPGDLNWDSIFDLGDCTLYERTPPGKAIERSADAEAIFTNKVIISRQVIEQLPKLKYIGVLATGYNIVDLEAATEASITVTNIPAYSTSSVAQMIFSHLLHMLQNVSKHTASVRNGEWTSSLDFSYHLTPQIELAGKTLGIIGFGQIGQAVATIGLAFGMRILFTNRSKKETDLKASQVDLDTLLAQSDFVSINCPLTENNIGFFDRTAIGKMKSSAILINTARGALVNEYDLADALNHERIAGACLDVLAKEPPSPDNPLLTARNCNITPHIAWATTESRSRMMDLAAKNLEAFIKGSPRNVVNKLV
ncbi:MAG: D-2-hydroxyacid dehydrogenase [Mariniphaga sp.]|nr:D-2-hydroxyacid dehydrogenase [Mariniphaga sp.]MDD4225228.1 D-2-hydroxyacid dehydrogenase [Mariniphaga sp.]MDD4424771.1 D-2-hydroxyacid dehydrogenase [Mariniphaga sp.]